MNPPTNATGFGLKAVDASNWDDADSDSEVIDNETNVPPGDAQTSVEQKPSTGQNAPTTSRWAFKLPSVSLPPLSPDQKCVLKIAGGLFLVGTVAGFIYGVTYGVSRMYGGPETTAIDDSQGRERLKNWLEKCLKTAGINTVSPGELVDHVLNHLQTAWTTTPVTKVYAMTPGWEDTVSCPDPTGYRELTAWPVKDYKFLANIFGDAVNDVLAGWKAALGDGVSPSQIILFLSLLLGVANNLQ